MKNIQYLKCACGGLIGQCDSSGRRKCELCGLEFNWYESDYGLPAVNPKTGWVFPVKYVNKGGD